MGCICTCLRLFLGTRQFLNHQCLDNLQKKIHLNNITGRTETVQFLLKNMTYPMDVSRTPRKNISVQEILFRNVSCLTSGAIECAADWSIMHCYTQLHLLIIYILYIKSNDHLILCQTYTLNIVTRGKIKSIIYGILENLPCSLMLSHSI